METPHTHSLYGIKDINMRAYDIAKNLKHTHLKLMQRFHPDKWNDDRATRLSQTINQSWSIITRQQWLDEYINNHHADTLTVNDEQIDLARLRRDIDQIKQILDEQEARGDQKELTLEEQIKSSPSEIRGHRIRRDRGEVKFLIEWRGLEELGPIWEDSSTADRFPKEFKAYIQSLTPKSRQAIIRCKPDLLRIFKPPISRWRQALIVVGQQQRANKKDQ